MYTNIDTRHALRTIDEYLRAHYDLLVQAGAPHDIFMPGLRTVMVHNIFRFGDTYWVQQSGTAMGAPPALMYATLYFGILEQRVIPKFSECFFYRRHIDDGFRIWVPTSSSSSDSWV